MSYFSEQERMIAGNAISRREAIGRVTALLGGVSLIGGGALLTACSKDQPRAEATANGTGAFTREEIAFLDEVADTILPTTSTPGAKAAQTGAFMALMVTDTYDPKDQQTFRDGMRKLDEASKAANNNVGFMQATPEQRLALLTKLDQEAKSYMDQRAAAGAAARSAEAARPIEQDPQGDAKEAKKGADTGSLSKSEGKGTQAEAPLQGDPRQQGAVGTGTANPAPAMSADAPPHYFRMMKELAMLGYFTSEIGYTQAMRYQETPGRWDPCTPYTKGEKAWAPHA